jgi:hypothetical protein
MDHIGKVQAWKSDSGEAWAPAKCTIGPGEVVMSVGGGQVLFRLEPSKVSFEERRPGVFQVLGADEPLYFHPDDREAFVADSEAVPLPAGGGKSAAAGSGDDFVGHIQSGGAGSGNEWTAVVCTLTEEEVVFRVKNVEVLRSPRSDIEFVEATAGVFEMRGADEPLYFHPRSREVFVNGLSGPLSSGDRIKLAAAVSGQTEGSQGSTPALPNAVESRGAMTDQTRYFLIGAGVLMAVGSFMPWGQAGIFTVSGTQGDGVLTLIAGVIVAIIGIANRASAAAGILVIVLAGGSGLIVLNVISNFADTPESMGMGLLVVAGAALFALIAGFKTFSERPQT